MRYYQFLWRKNIYLYLHTVSWYVRVTVGHTEAPFCGYFIFKTTWLVILCTVYTQNWTSDNKIIKVGKLTFYWNNFSDKIRVSNKNCYWSVQCFCTGTWWRSTYKKKGCTYTILKSGKIKELSNSIFGVFCNITTLYQMLVFITFDVWWIFVPY